MKLNVFGDARLPPCEIYCTTSHETQEYNFDRKFSMTERLRNIPGPLFCLDLIKIKNIARNKNPALDALRYYLLVERRSAKNGYSE